MFGSLLKGLRLGNNIDCEYFDRVGLGETRH